LIHFLSGAEWWYGVPVTNIVEGSFIRLAPYIRAGRAVFLIVLKGFAGREPVGAYAMIEPGSAAHRELMVNWAVDMQRGLDYLETRSDVDARKIAFWNDSTWDYGVMFAAIDPRYASVILIGAGLFRFVMALILW